MDEEKSDVPRAQDATAEIADVPLTPDAAAEGTSDAAGTIESHRDGGVLAQLRNKRSLAVAAAAAIATFAGGGAVGYAVGHSSDSGQHRFGPPGFRHGMGPGFGGRGGRLGGMPGRMGAPRGSQPNSQPNGQQNGQQNGQSGSQSDQQGSSS